MVVSIEGKLGKIKIFGMDVDGVLTNGITYYSQDGEVMKGFNMRDGMGVSLLREAGIVLAIITREDTKIVLSRAKKMRIEEVHIGIRDKLPVIEKILEKHGFSFDELAFIGDDINDIPVLKKAGFSAAPADAMDSVKKEVDFISSKKGGMGAVREVCDLILSAKKQ